MQLGSLLDLNAALWVFDCDGVLYKNERIKAAIAKKMSQFISSRYRCSLRKTEDIKRDLLARHQVNHLIRALIQEGFDEQEILEETYLAVNFKKLGVVPSPKLHRLLSSLPGRKVVLTNNRERYAQKVLHHLEISSHFSDVFGISKTSLVVKPDWRAFQYVQKATSIKRNIAFIDDKVENVIAAKQFGWKSVWRTDSNGQHAVIWIPELR